VIRTFVATDDPTLLEVMVNWIGFPATTGAVSRCFVFTRAASAVDEAGVDEGFPHAPATLVSQVVALPTVAVLVIDVPGAREDDTVPLIVTVAVENAATVGNVHETALPLVAEQSPVPEAVALTPVIEGEIRSVMVTV
jgi:hypothetical protein